MDRERFELPHAGMNMLMKHVTIPYTAPHESAKAPPTELPILKFPAGVEPTLHSYQECRLPINIREHGKPPFGIEPKFMGYKSIVIPLYDGGMSANGLLTHVPQVAHGHRDHWCLPVTTLSVLAESLTAVTGCADRILTITGLNYCIMDGFRIELNSTPCRVRPAGLKPATVARQFNRSYRYESTMRAPYQAH